MLLRYYSNCSKPLTGGCISKNRGKPTVFYKKRHLDKFTSSSHSQPFEEPSDELGVLHVYGNYTVELFNLSLESVSSVLPTECLKSLWKRNVSNVRIKLMGQLKLCWNLKTILAKLCVKGFSKTLSIIKQYLSCKMRYRLSDASNARSLVTSVPNVHQVRNVDTAVKIIYLGTAPIKIRKANVRTVI